jgi:peptidoglycan/LPS O-acetylase OafA/YrhL
MPTTAPRFYRPELDALRFCAFLSIFFFHSVQWYIPGFFRNVEIFHIGWLGQWGVPMFFFLSAYLITELLLRERDTFRSIHLGSFYIRRILRIWPLYFGAFWLFALINIWVPNVNPHTGTTWPWFTFFFANQYIAHHGWVAFPVDALWSISCEEQFYILIPLIAALGGRRALRIACIIVIAVSYFAIYRYARVTWHGDNGEWTNSLVQLQFFAGGTLTSIFLAGRTPNWNWIQRILAFAGGIACWIIAQTVFRVRGWEPYATPSQAIPGWFLVLIGCTLFLLCALGIPAKYIPRPMIYLGRISYGLYIFHCFIYFLAFTYLMPAIAHHKAPWPLTLVWPLIALCFCTVVGVASLSYKYFEGPFLRLKQRFAFIPSRPE